MSMDTQSEKDWLLHGGRPAASILFSDFIDYWLMYDLSSDEYFKLEQSSARASCAVYATTIMNLRYSIRMLDRIGDHARCDATKWILHMGTMALFLPRIS